MTEGGWSRCELTFPRAWFLCCSLVSNACSTRPVTDVFLGMLADGAGSGFGGTVGCGREICGAQGGIRELKAAYDSLPMWLYPGRTSVRLPTSDRILRRTTRSSTSEGVVRKRNCSSAFRWTTIHLLKVRFLLVYVFYVTEWFETAKVPTAGLVFAHTSSSTTLFVSKCAVFVSFRRAELPL